MLYETGTECLDPVERESLRNVRRFPNHGKSRPRNNMANFPDGLRRCFAVCLALGGGFGALFSLALLASAVTGSNTPSSVLLVGLGIIMLVLSALLVISAISLWSPTKRELEK
jgi:hypothetical protein